MQVARSPYKGVMDCIVRVFREEGLRAFFKSYRTTVRLETLFTAVGMYCISVLLSLACIVNANDWWVIVCKQLLYSALNTSSIYSCAAQSR